MITLRASNSTCSTHEGLLETQEKGRGDRCKLLTKMRERETATTIYDSISIMLSRRILSYPIVNNETRKFFILFAISNISSAPSHPSSNTRTLSSNFSPCRAPVCILQLRTEGPRRRYTKRVECLSSFSPSLLSFCQTAFTTGHKSIISPFLLYRILSSPRRLCSIHTVSGHRLVPNSCKPFLVHRSPSPPSFITSLYLLFPAPPPPLVTFLWFNSLPLPFFRLTSLSFTSPGLPCRL
ncbi:hypothetical protein HOY80DRAFT_354790 [Tuber brumale]|nr:hypothetical protein HOY80DRAFT_354790 [Tuber brumale]